MSKKELFSILVVYLIYVFVEPIESFFFFFFPKI